MTRSLPSVLLVVVLVGGAFACAPNDAPTITTHSTVLPLTGPCPLDGAGSEFTQEASSLRLTVAGEDIVVPLSVEGDVGALSVEEVPVGANRVVGLFGLVGSAPLWRGVTRGVTVERDVPAAVDVLMTRIGDVTCSRGGDADKRAFHTATVLDDGTILVIGGAKSSVQSSICAGCRQLEGTTSASLYDPRTGSFSPVGPLTAARMFHTATRLADGRVVVVGGAARGLVFPDPTTHPFPLIPQGPVAAIEVYDPSDKTFKSVATDPAGGRSFAAATRTLNDEVIITGGILEGLAARNDLSNALSSTTICGGEALSCRAGQAMLSRRAGHAAFTLEPDGIFIVGGSIDREGQGFQVEALRTGAGFEYLAVTSMSIERNFFFAATSQYVPFRLLVAGGLVRDAAGNFSLARNASGKGPVVVLDMSIGQSGGIVTGEPPNAEPMGTQAPRWYGAAAALPDETRAILAGGYSDLALKPSGQLEKYDQTTLLVEPLFVGGAARSLRQPRGALVAAANGDGSIVFTGGDAIDEAGAVVGPLSTAEIFGDPVTPPGVAE